VNKKVIEIFELFPESIRTQESEFVWGRYDQNTELDRDNSEQDKMTWCKRAWYWCITQTKLRTWPKPAIWLRLGHEHNKTNVRIKFVKAQMV
jgi:hypothetical protein